MIKLIKNEMLIFDLIKMSDFTLKKYINRKIFSIEKETINSLNQSNQENLIQLIIMKYSFPIINHILKLI